MANSLRGEVTLSLGNVALRLRPSFQALVTAEKEIGSLFQLLERAASGDVRISDIGALFWHCAETSGWDREGFETELLKAGPTMLLEPYRALVGAIFGKV